MGPWLSPRKGLLADLARALPYGHSQRVHGVDLSRPGALVEPPAASSVFCDRACYMLIELGIVGVCEALLGDRGWRRSLAGDIRACLRELEGQ